MNGQSELCDAGYAALRPFCNGKITWKAAVALPADR
jgi:hypothetical protein